MDLAVPASPIDPAATADPDRGLLDRFLRDGDREALGEVLARHADTAYRVARRLAGAADAEDALQEAFVRCCAAAGTFRAESTVRAWILAIAANAARDLARSRRRRLRREERAAALPPEPDDPDRDQESGAALAALDELPERYRAPLALRYLEGLEPADVAAALGLNPATARTRLARGLERLRAQLSRRGVALSAVGAAAALATRADAAVPARLAEHARAVAAKAALPVAAPAAVGAIAAPLVMVAIAALVSVCGYGWWRLRAPAASVEASPLAETPPAPRRDDRVDRALAQPITADVRTRRVSDVARELRWALPDPLRVPIVVARNSEDASGGKRIDLLLDRRPLREALDALCAQTGLRWRASIAGIVLDHPMPEAARRRLEESFAVARGGAMLAAARALADSGDVDCLRPLLLADGGERVAAARQALETDLAVVHESVDHVEAMVPLFTVHSSLVAFAGDAEVRAALLRRLHAEGRVDATDLILAGWLRAGDAFEICASAAGRFQGEEPSAVSIPMASVMALGWMGDARAVDPLLALAGKLRGGDVARNPIAALGHLRDPRAVEALLALTQDGSLNRRVREAAIAALGEIGDERAVDPLARLLAVPDRTKYPIWWASVANALAVIGTEPAAVALRAAVRAADEPARTAYAVSALGWMHDRPSQELLLGMLTTPGACRALERLADVAAVPRLEDAMLHGKGFISKDVARVLASIRAPAAHRALADAIVREDDQRLLFLADALYGLPSPEVEGALIAETAPGRSPERRRCLALALAGAGEAGARRAIDLVEHDRDDQVRQSAAYGFAAVLNDGVLPVPTMRAWLAHHDAVVRSSVIALLVHGQAGAELADAALRAGMSDADVSVRGALLDRLSGSGTERDRVFCAAVRAMFADADPGIRRRAVEWADHLMWERSLVPDDVAAFADDLLIRAGEDAEPRVRAEAAHALLKLARVFAGPKPPRADVDLSAQRGKLLDLMAREKDPRVRAAAQAIVDCPEARVAAHRLDWSDAPPPGAADF